MNIWVDADACPVVIKEILFRAAKRVKIPVTLVANRVMTVPLSPYIQTLRVAPGFDIADNEIVKRLCVGDLVITSDIPLAAEVLEKGGYALTPRGEAFSTETIRERLVMRDFMDTLRSSGINTGGPPALNQRDRKAFADQLDTFLTRMMGNG